MTQLSTIPYAPKDQLVRVPEMGGFMRRMFIHSTYGSNGQYNGYTPERCLTSLDAAVNRHAGNQSAGPTEYGLEINIMPGHAETLTEAAKAVIDQDNIKMLGHGHGEQRPKFTLGTAITTDIDLSGNNLWLENVIVVNAIDNLTVGLDITGNDVTLKDVETRDNDSTKHCDDFILAVGASRLQILNWTHRAGTAKAGGISALTVRGTSVEDVVVIPKWIDGNFSVAAIRNDSTALDSLQVIGSAVWPAYIRNRHATGLTAIAEATTKGRYGPYLNIRSDVADVSSLLVGAAMEFFSPISIVNADNERSMETSQTQSTS